MQSEKKVESTIEIDLMGMKYICHVGIKFLDNQDLKCQTEISKCNFMKIPCDVDRYFYKKKNYKNKK